MHQQKGHAHAACARWVLPHQPDWYCLACRCRRGGVGSCTTRAWPSVPSVHQQQGHVRCSVRQAEHGLRLTRLDGCTSHRAADAGATAQIGAGMHVHAPAAPARTSGRGACTAACARPSTGAARPAWTPTGAGTPRGSAAAHGRPPRPSGATAPARTQPWCQISGAGGARMQPLHLRVRIASSSTALLLCTSPGRCTLPSLRAQAGAARRRPQATR